jgi:hypothetical protein
LPINPLELSTKVIDAGVASEPDSASIHGDRAQIYWLRRQQEKSLMSKGIFSAASRESQAIAGTTIERK